jgi:hypothetical protein
VDGYSSDDAGNYTIDMEVQGGQEPCPPGAVDEMEPNCGLPDDTVNGGCNSDPPVFTPVACGDDVCGTAAAGGGTRDTDWYAVTLVDDTQVTWEGSASFPFLIGIVDNGGIPDCAGVSAFLTFATGGAGQTISVSACLPAGTWWLFAAPDSFDGVPCPSDYSMTVSCEPCTVPTGACCFSDGSCMDDLTQSGCEASGGTYQGDGSTCAGVVCVPICGPGAGDCFSSNGTPGCEDVDCCNAVCAIDPFCCDVTWDGICAGEALDLCGDPGACCFADGSCQSLTPGDCVAAGGAFQGQGVLCGDVVCPIIPDQCENAEPLDVPSTTMGSTVGAAVQDLPTCGTSILAPGAWYSVLGTGNTMTASTCGDFFDYDTKISVFCGTCDDLTCVDGNDDSCSGGASGLLSTVTWCSQFNAQYYILVHGFGGQSGAFELTLSDDGVSCTGGVECLPAGACCLADGSCVDGQTIEQCLALGGSEEHWFPGESCLGAFLGYSAETCDNPFVDISGTGTLAPNASDSDDGGDVVPLGFSFNFYGTAHSEVGIASNGYLTFGTDLSDFTNDGCPDPIDPNDAIFPYWDDWSPNQQGDVYYQSFTGPNRMMVQWDNVTHFGGACCATFQAILFENGTIEFRYGSELVLESPTVGVENADGTDATCIDPPGPNGCVQLIPSFANPIECPSGVLGSLIIKQGACPAPVNPASNGVVPMALIGDENIDATQVVLESLQLSRCDGQGEAVAPNFGPPGPSPMLEDLNHPYAGELGCDGDGCSCNDEQSSDGILDLHLFFRTNDLYEAGILAGTTGDVVTLVLTGELVDGTPLEAVDCIRLVQPGTPPGLVALQGVNVKGAWIDVTPMDDTLDGGGFGAFTRTYPQGTVVSVSAAPTHQGKSFVGWRVDGRPIGKFQTIALIVVGESQSVEAVYSEGNGGGDFSEPDGMNLPVGGSPPNDPTPLIP